MIAAVSLKGFLISLSLCMDIGIVNTALINAGIRVGVRPAFMIGLGSCFGDLAYAILCLLGMAVVLHIPAVRWVMWIGGGATLLWLAFAMTRAAWRQLGGARVVGTASDGESGMRLSSWREFTRGVGMAMASPSSIVWFAAVGGSVIAQSTDGSASSNAGFLAGFFVGGVAWSAFLALLAGAGRRWIGDKLKFYCSAFSAVLFAYLAVDVIATGYRTLL